MDTGLRRKPVANLGPVAFPGPPHRPSHLPDLLGSSTGPAHRTPGELHQNKPQSSPEAQRGAGQGGERGGAERREREGGARTLIGQHRGADRAGWAQRTQPRTAERPLHWLSLVPVCGQHHTPSRPATALPCAFQCFCQRVRQSPSSSRSGPEPSDEHPADMVKMTKSKTFQAYLPHCHRTYSCIHCRAHLANHDELISKSFQGSQGRAYLFNSVVNVGCGPAEERVLLTGLHAVADIYCENCKTTLGWKYEHAFESSQKYKEGKFIIELAHMIKDNGW
ncbi:protein yippee-like 1 [Grammomys surdaster]|uniref:protein yippee-like 1 n=1 Tax=Grammomys surdaster TaxID=491861 RepID=UPI0010A03A7F|nr:protein yippee-like 1 [Grammomys surdaster]